MKSLIERPAIEVRGRSVEDLLGQRLEDDERVVIMVYAPPAGSAVETRRQALDRIGQLRRKAAEHASRLQVTDEQLGAAVDEAVATVRRQRSCAS